MDRSLLPEERNNLKVHWVNFKKDLRCKSILADLVSESVIEPKAMLDIQAERTVYDQNDKLFSIMLQSEYNKWMKFKDILQRTDRRPLAQYIEQALNPHVNRSDDDRSGAPYRDPHNLDFGDDDDDISSSMDLR